ncbi:conserved hypothetical protein [Anaeromyxobacter dehalogenans 2CP-1]|uniref:Helix-turn-helix domain-containing protein n=1 Tax=Anaeromyxobacter dehalogenans (strain ATCC BAA-258 / DSM 21875 / 2CP-1) TaxID=455488 RepID=B8J975_ANAD2|nr:hypothetical protein [Anaeromyxobacter dehalogenans]ACL65481.1 conserved hypothetical protein [Anaeromyxobacter dehalogenans 2CP-1]
MTDDLEPRPRAPACAPSPLEAAVAVVAGLIRQELLELKRGELEQLVRGVVREVLGDRTAGEPETLPRRAAARAVGLSPATLARWQGTGRLSRGHRGRVIMPELRALLAGEQRKQPAGAVDLAEARARRIAADLKHGGRR